MKTLSFTKIFLLETTAPIKILKRAHPPSASAAAAANQKNLAAAINKFQQQPSRQQRQVTTPANANKARAEALHKHIVDFDITSPELTIIDDYLGIQKIFKDT